MTSLTFLGTSCPTTRGLGLKHIQPERLPRKPLDVGLRPKYLHPATPSQRAWQSFLGKQKKENPVHVADRFLAQARLPTCRTNAQVAAHFGVSTAKVSYYLALLARLPEGFVAWLRACDDPVLVGYLSEKRLRPATKVQDAAEQRAMLDRLISDARANADAPDDGDTPPGEEEVARE